MNATREMSERVDALAWDALTRRLDSAASRSPSPLLAERECEDLAGLFDGGRFRSTIDMARHRFGYGRYRYFDHPLPATIAELRGSLLPAARADRQRLVARGSAARRRVPARARGAARALPRRRAGAPDAADPAIRRGRLERPAPGPLRRRLLPVPGRHACCPSRPSTTRAASSCCSSSARARRAARTW